MCGEGGDGRMTGHHCDKIKGANTELDLDHNIMDEILAPIRDAFEGQIDFHGQRLAELLSTVLLIISGAVSFIIGYTYKDIYLTLWSGLAGTLFTAFVVVPPWPVYNRNPEKWLGSKANPGITVDGVKVQ